MRQTREEYIEMAERLLEAVREPSGTVSSAVSQHRIGKAMAYLKLAELAQKEREYSL